MLITEDNCGPLVHQILGVPPNFSLDRPIFLVKNIQTPSSAVAAPMFDEVEVISIMTQILFLFLFTFV